MVAVSFPRLALVLIWLRLSSSYRLLKQLWAPKGVQASIPTGSIFQAAEPLAPNRLLESSLGGSVSASNWRWLGSDSKSWWAESASNWGLGNWGFNEQSTTSSSWENGDDSSSSLWPSTSSSSWENGDDSSSSWWPSTPISDETEIPDNTGCFMESCYTFHGQKLPWGTALAACRSESADLLKISSKEVNDYIANVLMEGNSDLKAWAGGNDKAAEGTWVWSVDNSTLTYENWYQIEPNNAGDGENCMEIKSTGTWNDNACSSQRQFICQQATAEGGCSSDSLSFGASCYKLHTEELSWEDASDICTNEEGYLAKITSAEETNFIWTEVMAEDSDLAVWAGGNDQYQEGHWVWVDNTPLEYTNWYSEPNNSGNEDCMEIFGSGTWNDDGCWKEVSFICEAPNPDFTGVPVADAFNVVSSTEQTTVPTLTGSSIMQQETKTEASLPPTLPPTNTMEPTTPLTLPSTNLNEPTLPPTLLSTTTTGPTLLPTLQSKNTTGTTLAPILPSINATEVTSTPTLLSTNASKITLAPTLQSTNTTETTSFSTILSTNATKSTLFPTLQSTTSTLPSTTTEATSLPTLLSTDATDTTSLPTLQSSATNKPTFTQMPVLTTSEATLPPTLPSSTIRPTVPSTHLTTAPEMTPTQHKTEALPQFITNKPTNPASDAVSSVAPTGGPTRGDVSWGKDPFSHCVASSALYPDDTADLPLFSGDEPLDTLTLAQCKQKCETQTDVHGRPCVAIEWASLDETPGSKASCALAWACDWTSYWSKGSSYKMIIVHRTAHPTSVTTTSSVMEAGDGGGQKLPEQSLSPQNWIWEVSIGGGLVVLVIIFVLRKIAQKRERDRMMSPRYAELEMRTTDNWV